MNQLAYTVEAKKGDLSGLEETKKKIQDLKHQINQLEDSIKSETSAHNIAANAQKKSASAAASAAAKKSQLLVAVDRLASRLPGLGGAFAALKTVIGGLSLVGLIGMLTFLIQIGSVIYTKFFAPMIEGARKSKAAIKEWLGTINSLEGIMSRHDAATKRIDGVAKAYDAAARAADRLAQAQAKLEDAKAQAIIAAMPEGPAKEQAKRDLTNTQRDRERTAITTAQEREQYKVTAAETHIEASEKTLARLAANFNLAFQNATNKGDRSTQQTALADVERLKRRVITHQQFDEIYNGMTPEQVQSTARADLKAGRVTYAEETDDNKAVREAAEQFATLSAQINDAKAALANLKTEVEANVAALALEAEAITAEQDAETAAEQAAIDAAWVAAEQEDDAMAIAAMEERDRQRDAERADQRNKKEQAAEEARAMAFAEASPDQKRAMIDDDIAALTVEHDNAIAEKRDGDAALIANQITTKKRQRDAIEDPQTPPEPNGTGKEGLDSFIDDFARNGGRMPKRMANSAMARSFRASLSPSGFGTLGQSFSKSLLSSSFAKPGDDPTAPGSRPLEDNPAKLQREANSTLKRIETKLGMRD